MAPNDISIVLDPKGVFEVLDQIKALDLKVATLDELVSLFRALKRHLAITTTIKPGRVICRTVSCAYLANHPTCPIPTVVSQISYNPDLKSCGFNRANWQGSSMFYGSLETEKLRAYHTNSMEVLIDLQNDKLQIAQEMFVTGKWIVKKELPLVHISGNLKHNLLELDARSEALWKSIKSEQANMISYHAIDHFLCDRFVEEVPNGERWRYKITAAYCHLLKEEGMLGVAYPSLKTDGAGYNVALFPNYLSDYIELERAACMRFYKRGNQLGNEITMEAFPDNGVLRWTETYKYRWPPMMKNWYLGRTDDDSFNKHINYTDL